MITFLGDVALISDKLKSSYKPRYPYVFNCEYVIGNRANFIPVMGKINLCSQRHNFDEIFGCHPVAVSVINNHIYDFGEDGFKSTVDILKSKNIGIVEQRPFYLNDRICIVSYMDLGINDIFNFEYDKVKNDIKEIKERSRNVKIIVQIHWGVENHPSINNRQREIGHWLIDNGVDLVIGHHPHCIQPIEQYKGKYICYSLGNALFANINQPSHYDNNGVAKRIYRFRWQYWNKESLAINYDELTGNISVDKLYQKNDTLCCKKEDIDIKKYSVKKVNMRITYMFRKYFLFFVSNFCVDGKLFDMNAFNMERKK